MKAITQPLYDLSEYQQMVQDVKKGHLPIHVDGCIDSQKCHLISSIGEDYPFKLIVTHSDIKAREIYEDYRFFDHNIFYYPAKDIIFYNADIHSSLIISQRIEALRNLLNGEPVTIVTTVDGLLDRLMPLETLKKYVMTIKTGDILHSDTLSKLLTHAGFERKGQVDGPGQYAVRGGIIDIYNMAQDCPYRIELWDDTVDSIRSFDAESQRSIESCEELAIYPASEYVFGQAAIDRGLKLADTDMKQQLAVFEKNKQKEEASRLRQAVAELRDNMDIFYGASNIDSFIPYFFEKTVSLLDYFDNEESLVFLDEPAWIMDKGKAVSEEFAYSMSERLQKGYILPRQVQAVYEYKEILIRAGHMNTLLLSTIGQSTALVPVKARYSLTVSSIHTYNSDFEMLVREVTRWRKEQYRIIIVCRSQTRAQRLVNDLMNYELTAFYSEDKDRLVQPGEIMIINGSLHHGMSYPMIKFVIIAETDIFGEERKKRKRQKKQADGEKIRNFLDLSIGDYVVHEQHGIGIYKGIEKIEVDRVAKDYIKIEYGGGSNLYILATQLDTIQKYAGGEAKRVKLNKLGNQDWSRTKGRVHKAVRELAADLIRLYAARQEEDGYVYGKDTVWQKEFEEMFPYEETQDQLDAIAAAKEDMESHKIMDRLICGDVGFGKTEVAIRAAFKAVQEGKQVVLLVPTTILAQQHYNTFIQRMKDYPVTIGMLSRFRTKTEQKATLAELKRGMVDILIGTHRVLSKDVIFKDLGLLIVDEEQRFGVTHKEKIKKLKETVDVLTLTATPIPRTMHMSLIGIRDMSILEEAPVDRMPIQTYVMEYNEEMIREAIVREIGRGGQVYYVFNRVNGIDEIAHMIAELVPEAAVAFAHGQMSERELEKIMYEFINGEIDVLVSTTIIETGLDISNVNTMIIHDADKLGLSQLYQLRGRVGRSNRTAYAFLMYKRDKMLKEIAEKRLSAIREFTELGAGYKIAMRDLEIRGAGNLLGEAQSGHMEAVGYDLYCKMLNTAVLEARGEKAAQEYETSLDIEVDAFIPASYIKNESQKLEMYKRIASIISQEEYDEILDELIDRFGDIPKAAMNLLTAALIKAQAHEVYVVAITQKGYNVKIEMFGQAQVDVDAITTLVKNYGRRMKFINAASPYFTVSIRGQSGGDILQAIREIIADMKVLVPGKEQVTR